MTDQTPPSIEMMPAIATQFMQRLAAELNTEEFVDSVVLPDGSRAQVSRSVPRLLNARRRRFVIEALSRRVALAKQGRDLPRLDVRDDVLVRGRECVDALSRAPSIGRLIEPLRASVSGQPIEPFVVLDDPSTVTRYLGDAPLVFADEWQVLAGPFTAYYVSGVQDTAESVLYRTDTLLESRGIDARYCPVAKESLRQMLDRIDAYVADPESNPLHHFVQRVMPLLVELECRDLDYRESHARRVARRRGDAVWGTRQIEIACSRVDQVARDHRAARDRGFGLPEPWTPGLAKAVAALLREGYAGTTNLPTEFPSVSARANDYRVYGVDQWFADVFGFAGRRWYRGASFSNVVHSRFHDPGHLVMGELCREAVGGQVLFCAAGDDWDIDQVVLTRVFGATNWRLVSYLTSHLRSAASALVLKCGSKADHGVSAHALESAQQFLLITDWLIRLADDIVAQRPEPPVRWIMGYERLIPVFDPENPPRCPDCGADLEARPLASSGRRDPKAPRCKTCGAEISTQ